MFSYVYILEFFWDFFIISVGVGIIFVSFLVSIFISFIFKVFFKFCVIELI